MLFRTLTILVLVLFATACSDKEPSNNQPDSPRYIKGNVSKPSGEQIYFVPGQAYYNETVPEVMFETEEAAQKAGYRKSNAGFVPQKSAPTMKLRLIKGNISSTGAKIYHVPGQEYYDKTDAEETFETEEDAIKAGYRRANHDSKSTDRSESSGSSGTAENSEEPNVLVLLLVAVGGLALGVLLSNICYWRGQIRQNLGEAAVARALTSRFVSPAYHLLNNITLPVDDGTTQIDHILVSRSGIFVIETKHYRGTIFGDRSESNWVQMFFRSQFPFQNPIQQNHKHVATVMKLLPSVPSECVHSLVVFTGNAVFAAGTPQGVVVLAELDAYIARFATAVLTVDDVYHAVGRIECTRYSISKQTDVEHIAYLRNKYGDSAPQSFADESAVRLWQRRTNAFRTHRRGSSAGDISGRY